MIYFTSDLHIGHTNIIKYSHRPYWRADPDINGNPVPDIQAMNEDIVLRYNAVVQPSDTVYFLGDMIFSHEATKYLRHMHGHKFLITGNHDKNNLSKLKSCFEWINSYYEMKAIDPISNESVDIVMFHYPIASWNKARHGAWHLHGHCHGSYKCEKGKILDVGVDTNNMYPYSLLDVAKYMSTRSIHIVDHHTPE